MRQFLLASLLLLACARSAAAQTNEEPAAPEPGGPELVARYLLLGSARAAAGDLAEALHYFQLAHDTDPADPHLAIRYAETALELGQPRPALAALDRTAALSPDDPELEVLRVRLLLGLREFERAEQLTAQLVERVPEENEFLRLRALVLDHRQDAPAALKAYRVLEQRSELDAEQYERMAYLSLHAKQPQAAADYARLALRRDPRATGALELLAAALRELSREEEFEGILRELLEQNPQATELHSALADLLLARGDAEGAVDLLLPLAESGELGRYPRIILAELLMRLNRLDESRALLEAMLEEGAGEAMLLRTLGEVATRQGRLDEAVQHLERALRADPADRETMLSLLLAESQRTPEVFDEDGPPSEARDAFNRLLTRADEMAVEPNLRFDYLIGTMMRRAGRYGEALDRLQRAREQDPDSPEIVYDLAVCLEQLDRDAETRETLEQLVELAPEESNYLNFLGYFLAERGEDLDRAQELIVQALRDEPENPFFLDSLGWVYFQRGDYAQAIEQLQAAQRAGLPDDPTVLEHLGDAFRAHGDVEAALDHYLRAIENGADEQELQERIEELRALQEEQR